MADLGKIDLLSAALSQAQHEIKPPPKNKKVDFTDKSGRRVHYNYADLADLLEALKEPFFKAGLSQYQSIRNTERGLILQTVIAHSSGQLIYSEYPLPDPKSVRPQDFGSLLTYARRYSLSSLSGVTSEDDDDGSLAQGIEPEKPTNSLIRKNLAPSKQFNITAGTYAAKFGKHKGIQLRDRDLYELNSHVRYIRDEAAKQNKQINNPDVIEYLEKADEYLGTKDVRNKPQAVAPVSDPFDESPLFDDDFPPGE